MNVMRDFWNMRFCVENIFLGVIRCHEIAPELFGYGAYRFQIHLALGRGIAFRVLLGKAKGDMQVTAIAFLPGFNLVNCAVHQIYITHQGDTIIYQVAVVFATPFAPRFQIFSDSARCGVNPGEHR